MLQQLLRILDNGWPNNITNVPQDIREYWDVRNDIHTAENLLFMGDRLIDQLLSEVPFCNLSIKAI